MTTVLFLKKTFSRAFTIALDEIGGWLLLLGASLGMFLVGLITIVLIALALISLFSLSKMGAIVVAALSALCLFMPFFVVLVMGFYKVVLNYIDTEQINISLLFSQVEKAGTLFFVYLLLFLIVVSGLILLIVPGIYWFIKFAFAPYIIIDKNVGAVESLRMSWRLTQGNGAKIFWMIVALMPLGLMVNVLQRVVVVVPKEYIIIIGFAWLMLYVLVSLFSAISWTLAYREFEQNKENDLPEEPLLSA